MSGDPQYQEKLAAEAELWGSESERMAQAVPPDWAHHRHLRHNVVMHAGDIDALLDCIQPGMKVLELGCASGWLTLAMAERGARATGIDLSERSLRVARSYYESVREKISGTATYQTADLNRLELPADTYDVISVKSSLHHLVNLDHVIGETHKALKPGGLLWTSETIGDEALSTVLVAGALCFVLPTQTPYIEKIRALLRFGLRTPSRVKASMQAEGLSPFEGAGREHDWVKLVGDKYTVEKRVDCPAFTGYVTAQLKMPEALAVPILKAMRTVDQVFVRLGLLHNTGVVLYARK
jgi:2-polyprenyl-3-methyl-5-hydroxy-6-metoxy-1,4-benzoquinol methylase